MKTDGADVTQILWELKRAGGVFNQERRTKHYERFLDIQLRNRVGIHDRK